MSPVLRLLQIAKYRIGSQIDRLKPYLRSRRGVGKPIVIVPYIGYGNRHTLRLRGRVLEAGQAAASQPGDSRWRNFSNMWRRVWTAEVPGVRVVGSWQKARSEILTDLEGYFQIDLHVNVPPSASGLLAVHLAAGDPQRGISSTEAVGRVLVPGPKAGFGIITDIDDTIIRTGVGRKLTLALRLAFSNARTRAVYPGIPSFYRLLHAGRSGGEDNPFFYISGSPYNLYDMFVEILRLHGFPLGHIALKNFGLGAVADSMIDQVLFKTSHIGSLFDAYPHLRFVLIGDTGESDPDIYTEMVRRFPGRVPAIFLRRLPRRPFRRRRFDWDTMRSEVGAAGTKLVPLDNIAEAIAAAERLGLIRAGAEVLQPPVG